MPLWCTDSVVSEACVGFKFESKRLSFFVIFFSHIFWHSLYTYPLYVIMLAADTPQSVTTRSGSNQQNNSITLADISKLIETSKTETLASINRRLDTITCKITKITKRMDAIDQKIAQVETRCSKMEEASESMFSSIIQEVEDRNSTTAQFNCVRYSRRSSGFCWRKKGSRQEENWDSNEWSGQRLGRWRYYTDAPDWKQRLQGPKTHLSHLPERDC